MPIDKALSNTLGGLRLYEMLNPPTPTEHDPGLIQFAANVEKEPVGSSSRVNALTEAFRAFAGSRFETQQKRISEQAKRARLTRMLLAQQFMQQLGNAPDEVKRNLLPADLRFLNPGPKSIPGSIYESVGKSDFNSNLSAYIQANPGAKREDILSLMAADRAARALSRAETNDREADARRAENPIDRRFNNTLKFLEGRGVKLSDADQKALARQLAVGENSTVGLVDEPTPTAPAPSAPAQVELKEDGTDVDVEDPMTRLQNKYGLKF